METEFSYQLPADPLLRTSVTKRTQKSYFYVLIARGGMLINTWHAQRSWSQLLKEDCAFIYYFQWLCICCHVILAGTSKGPLLIDQRKMTFKRNISACWGSDRRHRTIRVSDSGYYAPRAECVFWTVSQLVGQRAALLRDKVEAKPTLVLQKTSFNLIEVD